MFGKIKKLLYNVITFFTETVADVFNGVGIGLGWFNDKLKSLLSPDIKVTTAESNTKLTTAPDAVKKPVRILRKRTAEERAIYKQRDAAVKMFDEMLEE